MSKAVSNNIILYYSINRRTILPSTEIAINPKVSDRGWILRRSCLGMGRVVSTGIFGSFFEERLRRENRREKERNRRSSTKREKEEEVEPRRIGLTKKKQQKKRKIGRVF